MLHHRKSLVALSIAGLIIGGCSTPSTTTVTEYRPRVQKLKETETPAEGVFQLVRWTPVASAKPSTTQPIVSAKPVRQIPIEVEQVYVPRGRPIGFRRNGGQLLAVSDDSTVTLAEAHYEWRSLPQRSDGFGHHLQDFGNVILGTVAVATVAAIVLGCVYLSLLDDCGTHSSHAGN